MFRNFFKLVYVTLPVAVLLALACWLYKPSAEVELFGAVVNNSLTMDNCSQQLLYVLSVLRFGRYWWVMLCALAVFALAMSIAVVKIDRHMRMGLMPVLPIRRAFGIFPLMLVYILCWISVSELCVLAVIGVSFLIRFVGNAVAIAVITFALTFAVRAFLTYLFALLIISFPLKYSENYRFNRAMSYSARAMYRKKSLMCMLSLLYPLCRLGVLALAYLLAPYNLDILVYFVAFLFAVTYVPCLAFKAYYDEAGGERRDISKIMFG